LMQMQSLNFAVLFSARDFYSKMINEVVRKKSKSKTSRRGATVLYETAGGSETKNGD